MQGETFNLLYDYREENAAAMFSAPDDLYSDDSSLKKYYEKWLKREIE